jgi:hypothetical protein
MKAAGFRETHIAGIQNTPSCVSVPYVLMLCVFVNPMQSWCSRLCDILNNMLLARQYK